MAGLRQTFRSSYKIGIANRQRRLGLPVKSLSKDCQEGLDFGLKSAPLLRDICCLQVLGEGRESGKDASVAHLGLEVFVLGQIAKGGEYRSAPRIAGNELLWLVLDSYPQWWDCWGDKSIESLHDMGEENRVAHSVGKVMDQLVTSSSTA